ncbi:hypothetical protein VNO77_14922 [Canavalia gladiata]|uniref:Uncharacterized protein n=1 Tax=Canavalia gladiata TaxID=3824 RepID=A0AAN9M3V2_CANGL
MSATTKSGARESFNKGAFASCYSLIEMMLKDISSSNKYALGNGVYTYPSLLGNGVQMQLKIECHLGQGSQRAIYTIKPTDCAHTKLHTMPQIMFFKDWILSKTACNSLTFLSFNSTGFSKQIYENLGEISLPCYPYLKGYATCYMLVDAPYLAWKRTAGCVTKLELKPAAAANLFMPLLFHSRLSLIPELRPSLWISGSRAFLKKKLSFLVKGTKIWRKKSLRGLQRRLNLQQKLFFFANQPPSDELNDPESDPVEAITRIHKCTPRQNCVEAGMMGITGNIGCMRKLEGNWELETYFAVSLSVHDSGLIPFDNSIPLESYLPSCLELVFTRILRIFEQQLRMFEPRSSYACSSYSWKSFGVATPTLGPDPGCTTNRHPS